MTKTEFDLKYRNELIIPSEISISDINYKVLSSLRDLTIMDINLNDVDGSLVCASLKAAQQASSIPLILITAGIFRVQHKACGADAFIEKPFGIDNLHKQLLASYKFHESKISKGSWHVTLKKN